MDESGTSKKVVEYERYLNEVLRTSLSRVLAELDKVYEEIAEYMQIKETIEKLDAAGNSGGDGGGEASTGMRCRVDLGCNFYANALVSDTSRVCVCIGYGFYLEMRRDEALRFIAKKCKSLNESADELKARACDINARIRFVLQGLKELQQLTFLDASSNKDTHSSLFL